MAPYPDLNPMDYTIWQSLAEKVYAGQPNAFTEEQLKEKIKESWREISLNEIRKSISPWKARLRSVIEQDGGSTDHLKN